MVLPPKMSSGRRLLALDGLVGEPIQYRCEGKESAYFGAKRKTGMKVDIGEIINLDRYPIADGSTPACQHLVEALRADLNADQF